MKEPRKCLVPSCDVKSRSRGYCHAHYMRWYHYGDPEAVTERAARIKEPDQAKFHRLTEKTPTCWLWQGAINSAGYGHICLESGITKAHRYSFFLHFGYWPMPMCLHSCDNRRCVNPDHLRAGTAKENVQDAIDRKRFRFHPASNFPPGELHNTAKLKVDQVREIRGRHANGEKIRSLAREFGLAHSTVQSLIARKTWREVL